MVDEKWINKAICRTGALLPNSEFVLKDLFDGIDWAKLSQGDRRDFGRQFKNMVNRGLVPNIVYIGKEKKRTIHQNIRR